MSEPDPHALINILADPPPSLPPARGSTAIHATIPADLAALYRQHRARLPALSSLLAAAMRGALVAEGHELPALAAPPRTAAATLSRWRQPPQS